MLRGLVLALLLGVLSVPFTLNATLRLLLGDPQAAMYPLEAPWGLTGEHIALVASTSAVALVVGLLGAVWAHWRPGSARTLLGATGTLLQTVPPVAFLALMVPFLGFGTVPVFWALVAFGILPIFHGALSAFDSVSVEVQDAASGLGFSRWEKLIKVDFPLALPGIRSGLRTSVMINIGTATVGATMGAGGLGRPILAGISEFNYSYLLQGALTAGVLALLADWVLALHKKPVGTAIPFTLTSLST
ncbi:MAG: ABC transporter permease [Spirochaetales bacterium]|nr:ABC transporter permease [Spirochaetales bacterium]